MTEVQFKFARVTGEVTASLPDGTPLTFKSAIIMEAADLNAIIAHIKELEKQLEPTSEEPTSTPDSN